MALEWKSIAKKDLPLIGQTVFLCYKYPNAIQGFEAELAIAVHRRDSEDGIDTYWDIENDQQYAIGEKWTHWAPVNLP